MIEQPNFSHQHDVALLFFEVALCYFIVGFEMASLQAFKPLQNLDTIKDLCKWKTGKEI